MIFKLFLSIWSIQLWASIKDKCCYSDKKISETQKFHELTMFTQLVNSSGVTVSDVF